MIPHVNSHAISIGFITQEHRLEGLAKLLEHLKPVVDQQEQPIELVVANNSGNSANAAISACLEKSRIADLCTVNLIDSPKNNIATGRNILLDHSSHPLLAMIDDDEFPSEVWLSQLLTVMQSCQAPVVAGPVPALFHSSAPQWVHTVDLHNVHGKVNEQVIDNAGTCNLLIYKEAIGDLRFDEKFGKSGGSDTDFFIRFKQRGGTLHWASDAVVYEDIPQERSTARYMIHRFIKQGENFRKINTNNGVIKTPWLYALKSAAAVLVSLPVAGFLVLIRHPGAGVWMKRAFSNYGKLHSPNKQLYES